MSGFRLVDVGGGGVSDWEMALFLLLTNSGLRCEIGENCWRGRGLRPRPA